MPTGIYKRKPLLEETKRKIGLKNKVSLLGNIPWNKGKGGYELKHSGQFKKGESSWNKGLGFSVETKQKMSQTRKKLIGALHPHYGKKFPQNSGENNYRWIVDRSKVKIGDRNLHDPLAKQWRKQVKDRDNWSCRIADNNCNGKLEVHHILRWSKFPELRYEVNNGITLCHFHHPRKINDEMKFISTFQELVKLSSANYR